MLSTQYRLRLESICACIANKENVPLEDMIWVEKLAKAHTTARDWLNKARRQAASDIEEGSTDDFLNNWISNFSFKKHRKTIDMLKNFFSKNDHYLTLKDTSNNI